MDIRETKYKNTVEYVMSCINCTVRHIYIIRPVSCKRTICAGIWDAWERRVLQVPFYTQNHYENTLRKEEANVKMYTKQMTCKNVHCSHVSKNVRRRMYGVRNCWFLKDLPFVSHPKCVRIYVRFVDTIKDIAELIVALCSLHRICTNGAILVTEQDNVAKCVERVGLREEECA